MAMEPRRFDGGDFDPALLAAPMKFAFSGQTANNRFMKASMTERMSTWDPNDFEKRGIPTNEVINLYRRWGEGGFGMILTGNVMLEYDHLEAAGNLIIPCNAPFAGDRFEAFKQLSAASKHHGSLIIPQLSHPGRQVGETIQKAPISASDIQLDIDANGMRFAKPRPMEERDFDRVTNGFLHAAEYCYEAGFDGVQLHGAQ